MTSSPSSDAAAVQTSRYPGFPGTHFDVSLPKKAQERPANCDGPADLSWHCVYRRKHGDERGGRHCDTCPSEDLAVGPSCTATEYENDHTGCVIDFGCVIDDCCVAIENRPSLTAFFRVHDGLAFELDGLSNPERAERIAMLSSHAKAMQERAQYISQKLAESDLEELVELILKHKNYKCPKEMLKDLAKALPEDQRKQLMNFINSNSDNDLACRMLGVVGATFGPAAACSMINMPASMGLLEFGRSMMAFFACLRAGGAAAELGTIVLDAAALETVELESIEALEAAEMIATGGRFIGMIGVGLPLLAAGIAIAIGTEVLLNLWMKDQYIQAEHEAAIARLQCRYQESMFEALGKFKEALVIIHEQYRFLKRVGNIHGLQKSIDEKSRKLGDEIVKEFRKVTYEQACVDLQEYDRNSGPFYDLDELSPEHLIAQTKQAVKEAADKAKQEREAQAAKNM
ncbi:hypothetical protein F4775DRAFT_470489 [Biscogniauxia sp. FL1348]|nr:hypothetical protein F4775DRAFT_470489 [Biscogniauxia sp. FL1348]